jgi:hypothetical protein
MAMAMLLAMPAACGGGKSEKLDGTTWSQETFDSSSDVTLFVLKFTDGKSCELEFLPKGETESMVLSGTYKIKGSTVTVDFDEERSEMKLTLNGNQLISDTEDEKFVLKKKS